MGSFKKIYIVFIMILYFIYDIIRFFCDFFDDFLSSC